MVVFGRGDSSIEGGGARGDQVQKFFDAALSLNSVPEHL